MAQNTCFFYGTFLIVLSIPILFGKVVTSDCHEHKGTVDVNQCGSLKAEQPTILGRNVTFTFTPETTSDADVKWRRAKKGNPWCPLPNGNKFTQYSQDGTYYLILTDTVSDNDEVVYRVDYKNNSVSCSMETPKLQLQDISNQCGVVYLRTAKVKDGENVELEYYPSKYVIQNPQQFVRQWKRSTNSINVKKDVYEEEEEPNDKYVLTIIVFNEQKNGQYRVYCGGTVGFSNFVEVILPVAPSAPAFEGLKDIDNCKGCIVGEDGDQFSVLCKTSGGTGPVIVTMSIGNESLSSGRSNETAGYITYFILHNRHHMAIMKCTVMNDALTSPLIIAARVYVIKSPTLHLLVPQILQEGNMSNITCIVDGGRPAPNVILNISGMEVSSAVKTESFNATTSLYTRAVSLTTFERNWNSRNVTCCRFNEWYNITNACSPPQRINLKYAPIIEFNISDSELPIYQGEQTHVKCSAESIPASNISWIEQTDVGNITMKTCQLQADCVIVIEANLTRQRQFICQTHYLETSNQKTLTVNIFGKDEKHHKDLDKSASGDNSFIWIILGSCLAVLFVVVIVCLIARKKSRNTKAKLEASQARFSANPDGVSRNKDDKLEDDPQGNLNDGAHGFDDSEVTYSQPIKNKPSSNADATYSEVNKTGQSNSSASCSKKTQQDGQLLYADLDFDPNGAPLKGAAAKRRNTPTEYVAIDFVKTAAEQAKENEPTEADNIYANQ